jgi:hypothetical protein
MKIMFSGHVVHDPCEVGIYIGKDTWRMMEGITRLSRQSENAQQVSLTESFSDQRTSGIAL